MQKEDKIWDCSAPSTPSSPPGLSNSLFWPPKQQLQDITCWKTNLMLKEEQERVRERSEIFRRRTSFEDNLINEHIASMVKAIVNTDLKIKSIPLPTNDYSFHLIKASQEIPEISSNFYLTEFQKWQSTDTILKNQQNFSILLRMAAVLDQNQNELIYLLTKILCFCSSEVSVAVKYNTSHDGILEMMNQNRLKLVDRILNQEVIKVVNPIFFSNVNEQPLMNIIDSWFYHILCIKQGLYVGDIEDQGEETHFEEENFFID